MYVHVCKNAYICTHRGKKIYILDTEELQSAHERLSERAEENKEKESERGSVGGRKRESKRPSEREEEGGREEGRERGRQRGREAGREGGREGGRESTGEIVRTQNVAREGRESCKHKHTPDTRTQSQVAAISKGGGGKGERGGAQVRKSRTKKEEHCTHIHTYLIHPLNDNLRRVGRAKKKGGRVAVCT